MSLKETTRLIEVNGKKFTGGLWWAAVDSVANAKKDATQQAVDRNMNLLTLYEEGTQFGAADVESSQARLFHDTWCLASILANKLGPSWVGIFSAGRDDFFAMVAVNEGRIMPGFDMMADLTDIREKLSEVADGGGWDTYFISDKILDQLGYIPALATGQQDQRSLEELLTEKKWDSRYKVRLINSGVDPKVWVAGGLVALLALGFGGWKMYESHLEQEEAARKAQLAEAARKAKTAKDRKKAEQIVAERQILPPWPSAPAVEDLLRACRASALSVPYSVAGWELETIDCTPNAASASYARINGTTMLDFRDAAESLKGRKAISSYSVKENKSSIVVRFELNPRGDNFNLSKYSDWSIQWISYLQANGLQGSLQHKPHPAPKEPEKSLVTLLGKEKAVPAPPWWATYMWRFSAENRDLLSMLAPFASPGMEVKKVNIKVDSPVSWKWSAEGEIHVKP